MAVLALCLGNAWGSRTVDPLDLPKAERPILSESAEDAGYYFNARWYSPERGSFTGRDPKEQFWTPYSYVGNGPLVGTDPTGMYWNYSTMSDAELAMHDNFTSMASPEEMVLYDRVGDDPTIRASHGLGDLESETVAAAFRWPSAKLNRDPNNPDMLMIRFRSVSDELPDVLLHETTHMADFLNNVPLKTPDGTVDMGIETRAWNNQIDFKKRNSIPLNLGQSLYDGYRRNCGSYCTERYIYENLYKKYKAYSK